MATRPPRRTGDDRTLQLAAPGLTAPVLDAYLAYQAALAERLAGKRPSELDAPTLSGLHAEALAHSRLSARQLEEVRSAVRRFVSNRLAARTFRARLAEAEQRRPQAGAEAMNASDEASLLAQRLAEELTRLEADLGHRDRPETVALLRTREDQLLELHGRLGQLS